MLTQLFIQHFTIIDEASIDFKLGMTVLTGETGAGKSILIDALGLALGNRADTKWVRSGHQKADITANFRIAPDTAAYEWLIEHDLLPEQDELLVRRTLSQDGRSKAFINGQPVTVQQLKSLGKLLVNIHSQHEHHTLLSSTVQRQRLDHFADHGALLNTVQQTYETWYTAKEKLASAQQQSTEQASQQALLHYQINELDQLAIQENEVTELEKTYQQLAHVQQLLEASGNAIQVLSDHDESTLLNQLNHIQHTLTEAEALDGELKEINAMLQEAHINLQEATQALRHYHDQVGLDPERLHEVETRLDAIHTLARKHQVSPEDLFDHYQKLTQQLQRYSQTTENIEQLKKTVTETEKAYQQAAAQLSQSRQKAALALSQAITESMQTLGMTGGQFDTTFKPSDYYSPQGMETVQFEVTTNPGQPLQPMSAIVSGGELSRISLAIQVLTTAKQPTPTLIFDEIDVGIGGATAEMVGQLLNQLGQHCQVLCVTHLPQVAAQGQHHLHVKKLKSKTDTLTSLMSLTQDQRHQEIARMLGGLKITDQTIAHAKEMLKL